MDFLIEKAIYEEDFCKKLLLEPENTLKDYALESAENIAQIYDIREHLVYFLNDRLKALYNNKAYEKFHRPDLTLRYSDIIKEEA